ncbi:MAG: MarR family transcriptional regulator [Clostridiales bacterium]|nr:MarR family transcriptional regulator [Clostridiales bacterium]
MKQFSEAFGRKLEGSGITRIQWISMYYINEFENISQRELSNLMCVKDSSIGRLIDRLERDGIVTRTRSTEDRRVITLALSEEGQRQFETLLPLGVEFNNQLIKNIPEKDLETFENVLKTMLSNIQE